MVFQSYHLLDDLTVQENIDLPLSYKDIPRGERQGMVADTLDHFQIVAKKDLYPSQLSGGQQQLVGIARAVIHKPALLLADEPTGNLHSSQAKEIMELFSKLNREGTTIVQVTHSDVNASYGSRTIQLRDGWLVSDTGNPALAPRRGGGALMIEGAILSQVSASRAVLCPCLMVSAAGAARPTPQAPAATRDSVRASRLRPPRRMLQQPSASSSPLRRWRSARRHNLAIPHSYNPFARLQGQYGARSRIWPTRRGSNS